MPTNRTHEIKISDFWGEGRLGIVLYYEILARIIENMIISRESLQLAWRFEFSVLNIVTAMEGTRVKEMSATNSLQPPAKERLCA